MLLLDYYARQSCLVLDMKGVIEKNRTVVSCGESNRKNGVGPTTQPGPAASYYNSSVTGGVVDLSSSHVYATRYSPTVQTITIQQFKINHLCFFL